MTPTPTPTQTLIESLRYVELHEVRHCQYPTYLCRESADRLESQAQRIAELEQRNESLRQSSRDNAQNYRSANVKIAELEGAIQRCEASRKASIAELDGVISEQSMHVSELKRENASLSQRIQDLEIANAIRLNITEIPDNMTRRITMEISEAELHALPRDAACKWLASKLCEALFPMA